MPPARTTSNKWRARHWAAAWSASLQHGIQKCKNIGTCVVVVVRACVCVVVGVCGRERREKAEKREKKIVECPI